MANRKDTYTLDIDINGQKAGKTYGDLLKQSRNLKLELKELVPGTEQFIKKSEELKKVNTRLGDVRKQTTGVKKGADSMTASFKKFLPALGVAAILTGLARMSMAVFRYGKEALNLFDIQAKADAQLRASLESTRGAAGRSFEQLKQQAADLQKQTLFGDETTQQAQAILLTFTNVRGEIFDRGIPAILDYATALKTAPKDAAIQLGKALNDPIKGISALGRAGVQFTDDQKGMITAMVQAGDTAGAQTLILKELETQFKGSAQAAAQSGLGGFTQLKNRLSDIQESVGSLITKGLTRLQPFLEKTVTFFEQLTARLTTGQKVTGKFASQVNGLVKVMKFLFNVSTFGSRVIWMIAGAISNSLSPAVSFVVNNFQAMITAAQNIPIIGTLIQGLINIFSFWNGVILNTSAAWEGLQASGQQAIDNLKAHFQGLVISAQILALKLKRALTIGSDNRAELSEQIKALEGLKDQAAQSGQSVGEAYRQAYDKAVLGQKIASADVPSVLPDNATDFITPSPGVTPPTTPKTKDTTEQNPLEGLGVGFEFLIRSSAQARQQVTDDLAAITDSGRVELDELKIQFLQKLLTEQQYFEAASIEKQIQAEQKMDLLKQYGLQETQAFRDLQIQQLEIQKDIDDQKIKNSERTAKLQADLQSKQRAEVTQTLDQAIQLFGKDEAARKKHAVALKAFETAKIGVNLPAEIQGIWKNAKITLPEPFATILAVVQTGLAIKRASDSVKSIAKVKFFEGGYTGDQGIYHDGLDYVAGLVHVGEHVTPKWQMTDPQSRPHVAALETIRRKKGGFALGGFTDVDTTPSSFSDIPIQTGGPGGMDLSVLNQTMTRVLEAVQVFPTNLKAAVVVSEFQAAASELQSIENESSI